MHLKIRIYALAKELGLDNKELIERANEAGIKIKNSALASISPEEKDALLKYIQENDVQTVATESEPLRPVRESSPELAGKVRTLRTMAPQPHGGRASRPADETATATQTPEPPVEVGDVEQPAEAAEADELVAAESPVAESEEVVTTPDDGDAGAEDVVPISRDDYVPAAGASGSAIREMKPRGTVQSNEPISRPKPKPKTSLPSVAAPPAYKLPKQAKPKEAEEPAQKPDMKLTPDILDGQSSPLAGHLRKHAEQKQRRKKFGEPESPGRVGRDEGFVGGEGPRRDKRRQTRRSRAEEEAETRGRPRASRRKRSVPQAALKTSAQIEPPITVRSLSEALGRPAKSIMKILFDQGEFVTINQQVAEETALEIALELGVDLVIKRPRDIEQELFESLEATADDAGLQIRPPIVTILGHVDHGKTTLLDKIRSGNVAAGEAGGITQHIAAYQVEHNGHKLTFVDTPGHAAFGEMRARGANVTDIVVLVVAADDGVMPQTAECISHAKAAGVPMVVAMNKIDLPETNEQKVLQDLAGQDVLPSEWGGDTEVVRTSATTGQGLDDLLETLLVTAELNEYRGLFDAPAAGVCLEAFRDEGRGVLAWLIVQKGTLKVGDVVLCGEAIGRIRAIYNDRDEEISEAGPSTPVRVAGLDEMPGAGDHFFVMSSIDEARRVAESRRHRERTATLGGQGLPRSLDDILAAARGGAVQDLPLIIKADTPGSIEALRSEITKFEHPEVRVQIVHEAVGGVNESDIYLASASGAIIIAFHVVPEDKAQLLAEREGVEIRRFNIIYEVTDTIKRSLEGLLRPESVEVSTGRALVLQTFNISRYGTVAGCRVLNGTIERSNRVHVIRDQTVLNSYNIASLKREKDDVKEVRDGMECGIRLDGFNDVKEGDLLEAYRIDQIKRTLD